MILIDETHISEIGIDWNEAISVIEDTIKCMIRKDYAQPIKPYLRYRNMNNRIIAMPAFVGGEINMAGIKWIASFPDNINRGIPRAHSVVILNNADTGQPMAIICTALLSTLRTASVSGMMIRHFDRIRKRDNINIGIIGFGPIGRYHLKMCRALLQNRIAKIFIYDVRAVDLSAGETHNNIEVVTRWEDAYLDADILITCTVSSAPYIDKRPKPGSLHLNVSLRDYKTEAYDWFKESIIVDDWEEVCREKTDIEMMHMERGLKKEDTRSITEVIRRNCLAHYAPETPVMFNPMGMAVFDIAMGNYYYRKAEKIFNKSSVHYAEATGGKALYGSAAK